MVAIPRRIKYERPRRGPGGTPTRRPSPKEPPRPSAEQVFREAYINLKLSNKLHEHRCAWAQCDFDGGDVASRSHEEHLVVYKEVLFSAVYAAVHMPPTQASQRLLAALGRDAAQAVLQQVDREWQQIKGIRRRTCGMPDTAACEAPGTASSSKKRSILKRAPSEYSLALVDGTPCRRVRLLHGLGEGSPAMAGHQRVAA